MSKSTKPAKKITATKTAVGKKKKTTKQTATQAIPVWLPPAVEPEKKSWWARLKEWFWG